MTSSTCELVQRALSVQLDGEGHDLVGADEHVAHCPDCTEFVAASTAVRRQLRITPVATVPDLTASVTGRLEERRRRTWSASLVTAAAAFLVGAVVAAAVLGVGGQGEPAAATPLTERLLAAQRQIETLSATVTVTERGWHPDVGRRDFEGTLRYRAPDSFALHLRDRTSYPDDDWVRGDIDVVIDDDRAWTRGVRSCPTQALPTCTPTEPRTAVVTGRAPFDAATPVPLDLAVPATSFRSTTPPPIVEEATVAGRPAIATEVTVAQLDPLLGAFTVTGNLRRVHPADPVRLWLDDRTLVPLRVEVRASADAGRTGWAASRGYDDHPGDPVLTIEFRDIAIDEPLRPTAFPVAPSTATAPTDGGFEDEAPTDFVPVPDPIPAGLERHRSGTTTTASGDIIGVRTWSDGLRWVKVRAVAGSQAEDLFGTSGRGLVPMAVDGGGTAYADPAANVVAVHGERISVALTGNIPLEELAGIASDLPVEGGRVPDSWDAAVASLAEARAAVPGLELPRSLAGFGSPALHIEGGFVTARYSGPGIRSVALTQGPGTRLPPPLDNDARTVEVDGHPARWSPSRGELEWIDGDRVISLRSSTVAVGELLAIARTMEPA